MTIYESLQVLAATGCGIQIGSYFMLSLFHQPIFSKWPDDISVQALYRRFYRFNVVIAIISGVLAIFAESRETGFLLAILGMSHILLLTHLLPAMVSCRQQSEVKNTQKLRRSPKETLNLLLKFQLMAHFSQLLLLIYLVMKLLA